jgi:hypothetical protein
MIAEFLQHLNEKQQQTITGFKSPYDIQTYLNQTPYSPENDNRCPMRVMQDRKAHCLDGALFAAAAFRLQGFPPIVIDLFPDPGKDDDHVLAIYHQNGRFGAVAKSNYTGLRYREPVYRTLRELVMSYFEDFFNIHGEKTLRYYTTPLDLSTLDASHWMWEDSGANLIEEKLKHIRRYPVIDKSLSASLSSKDSLGMDAGMLGSNPDGLYKPKT